MNQIQEQNYKHLTREQRGQIIAQKYRITRTDKGYEVPSQFNKGKYLVQIKYDKQECNCPDYEVRKQKCKHIFAVEYTLKQEIDKNGNIVITETVKKTYSQNWSAYDEATTNQKTFFMKLLSDITSNIPNSEYGIGRPNLPISDMLYSSIMKVFTTFSLRRFMGDMKIAKEKGYVICEPCYASIGHFLQREDITPLLADMVTLTSKPLSSVEKDFALDSTGFGTSNFQRWFSFKHGKDVCSRRWVKCHFMTGVKTNIITSVKVTSEFENDCPQLSDLINKTAESFDMEEVSGDKAYLSRDNMSLIQSHGAIPFIPFKNNSTGKARGSMIWSKMYHYFMFNNEQFLQHFHKRSNVETSVHMIKSKFGDFVRSKTWRAQVNETLCKVICHNICCIIQEMHELGINANFGLIEKNPNNL